jgi:hypothetical protein
VGQLGVRANSHALSFDFLFDNCGVLVMCRYSEQEEVMDKAALDAVREKIEALRTRAGECVVNLCWPHTWTVSVCMHVHRSGQQCQPIITTDALSHVRRDRQLDS